MSEQWHYEQKGESYIKVDTLHKIRTLETELAAARKGIAKLKEQYTPWWARKRSEIDKLREVTEQLKEAQEEIVKLTKGWADCVLKRSKAEEQRDRLVEALQKAKAVYTPSSGGEYQTGWHDAICWVNQQALQSLNQSTP